MRLATTRTGHRNGRGRALAAIAIAVGLGAGPARAQMIVNDPALFGGQLQQMSKDALEFGKQAQRWSETYRHYRQQLIKLQRLNLGGVQMSDAFPPRADDYGLQDLCPGAGGGIGERARAVLDQAMPKLDGNIVDEQQAICQRMVYAENAKYNESVRMLRTLMQRNQQFQSIEAQRDQVGDSQGALAANDNEVQRFVARIAMDLDYWQARMTAYQGYIESLKLDQTRLAKRAMRGKKGQGAAAIAGQVVQAAALKAALGY